MPLFSYRCADCGVESELLVRGQEPPACPKCGSTRLEKLLSAFAPVSGASGGDIPAGCAGCKEAGGSCPYSR